MQRVSLYTYVGNVASQRVAQQAGFRFEGTLRNWVEYRGQPRDAVMFSLIPEDLASR
jgi:ribosomal-protein-serine acetyltransferase